MLEAFAFGAPPHGGIAPGVDRIVMQLTDTENIREVIAFPKAGSGYDPMMDAPSTIDAQQWKDLTGASRKFTIPLAEYFDAEKLTLRVGDVRRKR